MRKLLICQFVCCLIVFSSVAQGQVFLMSTGNAADTIDENGNVKFLNLLSDPTVLDGLDLSPDQKSIVQDSIVETSNDNQALLSEMANLMQSGVPNKEAKARADSLMLANSEKLGETLTSTLMPDQLQSLKQLAFVKFAKARNGSRLISSKQVASVLDLSEDEQKTLKQKADEIEERLKQEIAELKERARQELIDELPMKKKELFKKWFVKQQPRNEASLDPSSKRREVAGF